MPFPKIDDKRYQQLTENAKILASHRDRPAIMLTPDQHIIKHIYKRGLWSSSTIRPYATRFNRASKKLSQLNIAAPTVTATYHYPKIDCDLIVYPFVDGESVHESASNADFSGLEKTPSFIAKLHSLGIYFHDLHLGNLIYHNNDFSLVDIATIKIYRKPLSAKLREKNLAHLYDRAEDRPILDQYGWNNFLERYQQTSHFSEYDFDPDYDSKKGK